MIPGSKNEACMRNRDATCFFNYYICINKYYMLKYYKFCNDPPLYLPLLLPLLLLPLLLQYL